MSSPHILLVMSHYREADLSQRRLGIFEATLAPSLSAQTRKPLLHVVVSPDDPLAAERARAIDSTGCEWRSLPRKEWRLYGEDWELPEGHKIVSRCDDDDVLRRDFAEVTYNCGMKIPGERAIIWPNNYTYWRGKLYHWHHNGNQFVSLSTSRPVGPHYIRHSSIAGQWAIVRASMKPGAIWVRHGDSESSTLKKYRSRLASPRSVAAIPAEYSVSLESIDAAIAASGIPSANYKEHAKAGRRRMTVSQWLIVNRSDKTGPHFYGSFYDALFSRLKPEKMLEVGVRGDASLRAWRAAGVSVVLGAGPEVKRETENMISGRMPDEAAKVLGMCQIHCPLDLIVDGGGRSPADYKKTAEFLLQILRPGGAYVIESIKSDQEAEDLRRSGWLIEDFRKVTGVHDDCIAWMGKRD